jgi:hypothetical protein
MARKLIAFCGAISSLCLALNAGVLPDDIGKYHRASAKPVKLAEQPLWKEYGFQQGETAAYKADDEEFTVTAWRLLDATGALGAFEWQRPDDAQPSKLAELAAETKDGLLVVHNNYLLSFAGHKPDNAELLSLASRLKDVDSSPLPSLPGFLPGGEMVPNSQRYVLGPAGLAKFVPGISPSTAGFHLSAEAQLARFKTASGEMTLALFEYPTPQIARQRLDEFRKIPNVMAKRSGPLVGVVLSPANNDDAEGLLGQIRYKANLTMDEYVPTRRDNIGHLVINAFELTGILLIFCTVSGLAFGGWRLLRRKKGADRDALTELHLADHQNPPPVL